MPEYMTSASYAADKYPADLIYDYQLSPDSSKENKRCQLLICDHIAEAFLFLNSIRWRTSVYSNIIINMKTLYNLIHVIISRCLTAFVTLWDILLPLLLLHWSILDIARMLYCIRLQCAAGYNRLVGTVGFVFLWT